VNYGISRNTTIHMIALHQAPDRMLVDHLNFAGSRGGFQEFDAALSMAEASTGRHKRPDVRNHLNFKAGGTVSK
jgi:hypothetical protein